MTQTAKLFSNGRSQAVRLPAAFRFEGTEVFIRQDPASGDVILSTRPSDWRGFVDALQGVAADDDFLSPTEREQAHTPRDPFEGAVE